MNDCVSKNMCKNLVFGISFHFNRIPIFLDVLDQMNRTSSNVSNITNSQYVKLIQYLASPQTMNNSTLPTEVIIINPFDGQLALNIIASCCYIASLLCCLFLMSFAWLERTKTLSPLRPITQQLISFQFFQVSYFRCL